MKNIESVLKHKLHNHPQMEKDLGVPTDHCIIDREIFDGMGNFIRTSYKELLENLGKEIEGMKIPVDKLKHAPSRGRCDFETNRIISKVQQLIKNK